MPWPTHILSPPLLLRDFQQISCWMPWDFTHFLLPAALASALATLAALAALEVASALARLPGLALARLQEAGTTLALGGFSSLAPLQEAGGFGSGVLVVDQARLSVGHHGQKKTEDEDGESLGDHFSELVVK
mmetsp:Transcript_3507/g.8067  ORF Transcript_3507/g.8067 Transcript_3507/m.8067 type:complete len:132 (-) Transcript_3507:644-1039(-)